MKSTQLFFFIIFFLEQTTTHKKEKIRGYGSLTFDETPMLSIRRAMHFKWKVEHGEKKKKKFNVF